MDFNFKTFQIHKLKKYFKNNDLFFLSHSAKLNSLKWINIEQNLKKLKLNYYKPLNKITIKTIQVSIYKNFSSLIGGFILFINPIYKTTEFTLPSLIKSFNKTTSLLIGIKLNNKIYSTSQLKGINFLSYKKNMFILHKTLDKYLKTSYTLTVPKKVSK